MTAIQKMIVLAGDGRYPQLLVEGAKRYGVPKVDVVAIRGSCTRATVRAADGVVRFAAGEADRAIDWIAAQGYDGVVMAGQVNPMSLFCGKFTPVVRSWLDSLAVKNAHTIFGKLVEEMVRRGLLVLPASAYMDGFFPGVGQLTRRGLTERERDDVRRGMEVAADVGRHDVGQTVLVKSGMVLAVEAFEGTNAAIRRAGKLNRGAVLCKAARDGHDWRFDIPVIGLKTLKTMRKAGVTAVAFQAGRQLLLDREDVIAFADRHDIAVVGIDSGLPPAPLRP